MSKYAIYKYNPDKDNLILLPLEAEFLDVQIQNGEFTLWYLANPESDRLKRRIRVEGTGWPLDKRPGEYLGTVQQGSYVWHIFDAGWEPQ